MQSATLHDSFWHYRNRTSIYVGVLVFVVLSCVNILVFGYTFGLFSAHSGGGADFFSAHQPLGISGVSLALSTQIGSGGARNTDVSTGVENSITIGQVTTGRDGYVQEYFTSLDAYARILNQDLSVLLQQSSDRAQTLDVYIDELVFRRADAIEKITTLQTTSDLFSDEITSITQQITTEQQLIESAYVGREEDQIFTSLDRVEQLRAQEIQLRGQRALFDKLTSDFIVMQNVSEQILEVVVPNREIIASGQTLSVSDAGTDLLEKLGSIIFQNSQ